MVIVDEVTPDAEVDGWFDTLERFRDHTHMRAYTLDEWKALIREAGLSWIVGDSQTRYGLEVESWLGRMNLDKNTNAAAYSMFSNAGAHAQQIFAIEYEAGQAVRFEMPMALILAIKP